MKRKLLALVLCVCVPTLAGCYKKPAGDRAEEILNEMTLEEKVYQMMFVTPEDITKVSEVYSAGEKTKAAIEKYPVGGIIYFKPNLKDRNQTIQMISNTQNYSKIPLFISVDEEGGLVSRLGSNPAMGVTKHPTMAEIGETKDPQKAYEVGKTLGKELKELGFNVDFAPVADVLIIDNNTEIGSRSFGYDTDNVSLMVENLVKGIEENNVSATLKHFPGAGAVTGDSHDKPTESSRTLEEIRETELKPFKAGIDAGTDFVMVSHLVLTQATEEKLPSSLSQEVIKKYLKQQLGFKGIVITDSLRMNAVSKIYTPEQIGIMCIKAGVDMLLMPEDFEKTHKAIVEAVKNGEIAEERINESVKKIIRLKDEKSLWR